MTESEIAAVVARLDSIDRRLGKLEQNAVTWKTLLLAMGTVAAVITAVITLGNQLWGA